MSGPFSENLSGFAARRARFEHDRDQGATLARLDLLCETAMREGCRTMGDLANRLQAAGIDLSMPRLASLAPVLDQAATPLTQETLAPVMSADSAALVQRALDEDLAIERFGYFTARLSNIFAYVSEIRSGDIADYIPELAQQAPDAFGLSVCSIDGQRLTLGDAATPFCLQSVVKPLNYALAMALNGDNFVHRHVGREPSGRRFNELALDPDDRPHNPMINAGAIMCAAMIRPGQAPDRRLDLVRRFVASAAGGEVCGFEEAVYRSERETASRNLQLVNLMDEHDAFPEGTDTREALDLYFRTCALTLDCDALSVVAAMLANGGVCPLTGHRIVDAAIVRNTLSLMLTCGMYDYSGEYAFTVGLPAKSGVSGGLMLVIPGIAGVGLWSPRLDRQGNSVRGVAFSQRLVEAFPFHIFAGVATD